MSKRITDTGLGRLTDAELDDIGDRIGMEEIHPTECEQMLAEIRAHRAAALTPSEVEALEWVRRLIGQMRFERGHETKPMALTVLDRLLAASEPKP